MARSMSASMQSALAATDVRPIDLVEMAFTSQTVRLCSASRDISWNSQTWLGNGWLNPLREISDTSELRAIGVEVPLVGADQSVVSLALSETGHRSTCKIWLGLFDSSWSLIVDPVQLFKGYLDQATINDDGRTASVSFAWESDLTNLERPVIFRYTKEGQRSLFPSDKGFDYVHQVEDWSGFWGKSARPKINKRRRTTR